jgi:hypothetical protein
MQSQFIVNCFCTLEKIKDENKKAKIKEKMLFYESDIFFIINFSLGCTLPYPFLKAVLSSEDQAVLNYIIKNSDKNTNTNINININNSLSNLDNDESKIKRIKEIISEVVNYSFLFPFFLNYTSEVISLSCLKLALKKLNTQINIIDIINIIISCQKETEIVSIDVNDINDIEICSSLIDELILSKIPNFYPQQENNIININNINTQNLLMINAEYDAETKHKMELKEKTKNETLLRKKRK